MSAILSSAELKAVLPAPQGEDLAVVRAELDELDDALHDLLIRRAEAVERIAAAKRAGLVALRPGREASILRRLLGRHSGGLPRQALVRIWRELFAGTTAMQGDFSIAVCDTEPGSALVQIAREHFGALTPLRVHGSPAQALAELSAGAAGAAVLPLPAEGEPLSAAWWTALLQRDEPRIRIVARLPFWAPRPEGAPRAQALIAASIAPDASGRDRSLLGLELSSQLSRASLAAALENAGLSPGAIILRREPGAAEARALVDVQGYVQDDDDRLRALTALQRPALVLGAYAVPVGGEAQ
ncbi:MAG: chorismate mutase [Acidisphaera sp.]|nr:chorismate mutase [Acidisphaera sp.]